MHIQGRPVEGGKELSLVYVKIRELYSTGGGNFCLMKNHFHLMVKTLGAAQIVAHFYEKEKISAEALSTMPHEEKKKHEGVITAPISEEKEKIASKLISRQFATLFNSYAQAINKSYDRTGGLFEEPFRRAAIRNEAHCCSLMAYIHTNAQKHNFVKDFRLYPHSSYQSYLSQTPTRLKRSEALSWFGGKEEFEQFHLEKKEELEFTAKYLEFD